MYQATQVGSAFDEGEDDVHFSAISFFENSVMVLCTRPPKGVVTPKGPVDDCSPSKRRPDGRTRFLKEEHHTWRGDQDSRVVVRRTQQRRKIYAETRTQNVTEK